MKYLKLLTLTLLITGNIFSQTLKIQTGTSLSKLDWQINTIGFEYLNETLVGFSIFGGIEYLNKDYFNLSTNIGYLVKGGKDEYDFVNLTSEILMRKEKKVKLNYITLNTLLDFKYPINDKIIPFVSIGPRIDYLLSYSDVLDKLDEINELDKLSFGLSVGAGVRYQLSKVRFGIRTDYYVNFNEIAEWPSQSGNLGGKISDKTLLINLSIGYVLK